MRHFRSLFCMVCPLLPVQPVHGQSLTALELFWSYGRSPPVYPSPVGAGLGDWNDAYSKARAVVAQMTNDEKSNLTYGYNSYALASISACSGVTYSVPRLQIPGLCLSDAGNGLRATDFVNAYPAGVHVAASWNASLALDRGLYMGREFKAKGVNVMNGPVVGPLGRMALGGRNWEGFSPDPYLSGKLVGATVQGVQESVITAVKHFVGYEQETQRTGVDGGNASYSANIDDKTMHELYLWPFMDAVRAGAGAIMCSYNRVNDSYASQNSKILNGLLKTELAFQGFVVSDWGAQHTGIASANAGLDMAMPNSSYWEGTLAQAVANGTLSQTRLNDMATRILASWYKLAQFDDPGRGMPPIIEGIESPAQRINARDPASKATILQGAVEGQVLVKNTNSALPLSKLKTLSIFGYDAGLAPKSDPVGSLAWYLGYNSVNVTDDIDLTDLVDFPDFPESATRGVLLCGGGSGSNVPAYISTPFSALVLQAEKDETFLNWDLESTSPYVPPNSDACLVFINEFATEQIDRPGLADPSSDELVSSVANQCLNTIVVIHNAGIRLVSAWIDNPNVTAVVFAHLPGQDGGRAVVEILYGYQSPSGRLPYTVARNAEDYGTLLAPTGVQADSPYYPQVNFTEGVYIDYRSFVQRNITPQFEFGFGLTYTTFAYSALTVSLLSSVTLSAYPPGSEIAEGGLPSLWDTVATVEFTVTNSGKLAAAEVPQVYVGVPGGPEKVLRGFAKLMLQVGQSQVVAISLTRRDLSTWDVVGQNWLLQGGTYQVYVGASVLDIRLVGKLDVVQCRTRTSGS